MDNIFQRAKFRLQYISDLHMETNDINFVDNIKCVSDNIALLGDIGYPYHENYTHFLTGISKKFKNVFLLAGNHEYYQYEYPMKTFSEINLKIQDICKTFTNVHFLNNDCFILNHNGTDVIIVGSTLWTNIDNENRSKIKNGIADYMYIYKDKYRNISIDDTNLLNSISKDYISSTLEKYKNNNVVVLSHHLPTSDLIHPRYKNNPLNSAFFSDCSSILHKYGHLDHSHYPLKAWICGHSHSCIQSYSNGVYLGLNCFGYPNQLSDNFSFDRYLEFDL